MKIIEVANFAVDSAKQTLDLVKHTVQSKEHIIEVFEYTGGQEVHEHRFLHTGEILFSKVMLLVGV